jgi:outer membrane lipase/esterase
VRVRASHVRTIGENVKSRQEEVGRLGVFFGADSSDYDIDTSPGVTGVGNRMRSGTVGISMRASETVTLGIAYGNARSKGTFGMSAGNFYLKEETWSVFGHMRWGGFYGTGVLSLADLSYGDMHRNVTLGAAHLTTTAATEGSNSSAYFAAGYDFPLGRFLIGPTVSVLAQNVDVNGFDESGGGAVALRMYGQKRKSEVWSIGARASFAMGNWTPWLRVTADKERRDDARVVTATPLTLASGNSYDIPAYVPDTSFVTAVIGIHGQFTDRIGFSLAYTNVSGRTGVDEDAITGVLSIRF